MPDEQAVERHASSGQTTILFDSDDHSLIEARSRLRWDAHITKGLWHWVVDRTWRETIAGPHVY